MRWINLAGPSQCSCLARRPAWVLAVIVAVSPAWVSSRMSRAADPSAPRSIFDDDLPASPPTVRPAPPKNPVTSTPKPDPDMTTERPVVPPALPPDVPATANGRDVVPGLIAEMYKGPDFGTLQESRVVSRIRASFEGPVGEAPFSIKWSGSVNIPVGGMTVAFILNTHATATVEVDGQPVGTANSGRNVNLAEGVHPITVKVSHIMNATGQKQTVTLRWVPAGEEVQPVPSALLSHYKKDEPAGILSSPAGSSTNGTSTVPKPEQGGVTVSPAMPSVPPVAKKGDLPVPSDTQLAELRKSIKTKFATYYSQPGLIVRQSLVKKLLEAVDTSTSTGERYALLREASDTAAGIGDLKTALTCDETLAGTFKVDEGELKLTTLTAAQHAPKNPTLGHDLGMAAMEVSDHAIEAEEYDLAVKAAILADNAFTTSKDEEAAKAKTRVHDVREVQAQFARIAPLLKKLKENPSDADTNLKVGRYFCFTVGNWEKGISMLAKGSDIGLKGLAEIETTAPTEPDAQLKLGDAWWDKATSESIVSAAKCKERASFWYEKARYGRAEEVPDQVLQRLGTLSRTIDLAARAKLPDSRAININGVVRQDLPWKREHGVLVYSGLGFYDAGLDLPYRPVGDYDFIVEFTVTRGTGGITQIMPVRGLSMEWTANQNHANFGPVALRPGSFGPILHGTVPVVPGRRFQSVVQFRRGGVRGFINGTLIRDWATDYNELGTGFGIARADPKSLAIRCAGAEVVVHAIRVVEVPRGGK